MFQRDHPTAAGEEERARGDAGSDSGEDDCGHCHGHCRGGLRSCHGSHFCRGGGHRGRGHFMGGWRSGPHFCEGSIGPSTDFRGEFRGRGGPWMHGRDCRGMPTCRDRGDFMGPREDDHFFNCRRGHHHDFVGASRGGYAFRGRGGFMGNPRGHFHFRGGPAGFRGGPRGRGGFGGPSGRGRGGFMGGAHFYEGSGISGDFRGMPVFA